MTASIALTAIVSVALVLALLGCLLYVRLRRYRRGGMTPPDAAPDFSLARYEPMIRLLGSDDLLFLRQHPRCGPPIAAQWKSARRRIFRMYLGDLAADFRRLHARARALVAQSPEQYSELVGVLIRQQVTFWRVMAGIELWLVLDWAGLGAVGGWGQAGAVARIRRLLDSVGEMHAEIGRSLAPASSPA